jgi:hypothetical protein
MDAEFLRCPTCETIVLVEVPQYPDRCPDGHTPEECPDRACTQCGTALLCGSPQSRRGAGRSAA